MKLLALHCNNCGAPTEVPRHLRFVKCSYCEVELSVQEAKKPVVEPLHSSPRERPSESATEAELENFKELTYVRMRIRRLNSSWHRRRMKYAHNGVVNVPTKFMANVLGVGGVLMGSFFLIAAVAGTEGTAAFTVYCFFGGLMGRYSGLKRAEEYERMRDSFSRRRRELSKRLAELKRSMEPQA